MNIGLIIVGDEILSGRRQDKHLSKVIEILAQRGLSLSWAHYVGDVRNDIVDVLRRTFATDDLVFSTGGIGGTPDDHTRQAAAQALGRPIERHPQAERLIIERAQEIARERGITTPPDITTDEYRHRLSMADFPQGAALIPNPYNKIAGFSVGRHYFVPGFPVMAWPMIEWVLDTYYIDAQHTMRVHERSIIVFNVYEAQITALMEQVERDHAHVKVFSLPSVGDATMPRHIELGVKGPAEAIDDAFGALMHGLQPFAPRFGAESRR